MSQVRGFVNAKRLVESLMAVLTRNRNRNKLRKPNSGVRCQHRGFILTEQEHPVYFECHILLWHGSRPRRLPEPWPRPVRIFGIWYALGRKAQKRVCWVLGSSAGLFFKTPIRGLYHCGSSIITL